MDFAFTLARTISSALNDSVFIILQFVLSANKSGLFCIVNSLIGVDMNASKQIGTVAVDWCPVTFGTLKSPALWVVRCSLQRVAGISDYQCSPSMVKMFASARCSLGSYEKLNVEYVCAHLIKRGQIFVYFRIALVLSVRTLALIVVCLASFNPEMLLYECVTLFCLVHVRFMISKIYYTVLVRVLGHWRSELGANTPTRTPYYGIYTVRYECSLYDD